MAQNLMGTETVLIDKTTDPNYIYIGSASVYKNQEVPTSSRNWRITRITIVDGSATEIKNAHADDKETQYFIWDNRTTYNYI